MVNTFLPSPFFHRSAELLDNKRLGKQRVEAWQILQALRGSTKGWVNHPATKMWKDHEKKLCEYGIAICDEWIKRGFKDTMREKFIALYSELPDCDDPNWLGEMNFHRSHQSNLKRKDPDHYNFNVPDNLPYLWADGIMGMKFVEDRSAILYLIHYRVGATKDYRTITFRKAVNETESKAGASI